MVGSVYLPALPATKELVCKLCVANSSPAGLAASLASLLPHESGYTGILVAGYLRAET